MDRIGHDQETIEAQQRIALLQLELLGTRKKIAEAESQLRTASVQNVDLRAVGVYLAKTAVAIAGALTLLVTLLTYIKDVNDSHAARYYELVNRLAEFPTVTSENADRAIALISQLESEFFSLGTGLSSYLFTVDEDRAFQIAYIVQPFARVYGENLDKVGIIAGQLLGDAVAKMHDPVKRDLLLSDFGDHLADLSADFPNNRDLAGVYLSVMQDVQCQIALLSQRVGRATVKDDNLRACVIRLGTDDPLETTGP